MKTCAICGSEEHPVWKAHVFKSHVFASNIGDASNSGASNSGQSRKRRVREVVAEGISEPARGDQSLGFQASPVTKQGGAGDTKVGKQRWSRKAYNAYQREYMRVWREKRRAKG